MTREEFLEKARATHGDKYEYIDIPDEFVAKSTYIKIICPKHGIFEQIAKSHYSGYGCRKCAREIIMKNLNKKIQEKKLTNEEFVKRASLVHNNKYIYDKTDVDNRDCDGKVIITCPIHGDFKQDPNNHLAGNGCKECAKIKSKQPRISNDEMIKRFRTIHGDKFIYDKTDITKKDKDGKVIITCRIHGDFKQDPHNHERGTGCPYCAGKMYTEEDFKKNASLVHNGKYTYEHFIYIDSHTKGLVTCPIHGDFPVSPMNHVGNKSGCPKCSSPVSKWEIEVCNFLKEIGIEYEQSNRKILNGREIDILIPSFNIGIECDGIRWHSEEYKSSTFHLEKTNDCLKQGIRLIHIFEDEWMYKSEIWKSMLRNMFGLSEEKIYARKCEIKRVNSIDSRHFLEHNHIQGFSNGKYAYGLYYKDELVSLMTFGKQRINLGGKKDDNCYELVRFCNKLNTNVIGGASKLFKAFINDLNPDEVISYSDKRWSTGKLYDTLGFMHIHDSKPNYFYVINSKRENRFKYRKDRLIAEGFNKDKTEHDIMLERGIFRIYDCGCRAHLWKRE